MKLMALPLALMLFFVSCNGKKEASVQSASADGKVTVKISGKRTNVFDPFKVDLSVKAYDFKEGKLIFEIMSDDLNSGNVSFDWKDNQHCTIKIEERDKNVRAFGLIATPDRVQVAEL